LAERLFLVGMMGSGKTTVGRLVAERLDWAFLDSDEQVCARTGRSVREIFEADGESAFRAEERAALEAAVVGEDQAVVAVAGGAVLDPANRALLAGAGTVVWLRADPARLASRVVAGRDHRPLLGDDPASALIRLDAERRPLYGELAEVTIDVDDLDVAAVVEAVLAAVAS